MNRRRFSARSRLDSSFMIMIIFFYFFFFLYCDFCLSFFIFFGCTSFLLLLSFLVLLPLKICTDTDTLSSLVLCFVTTIIISFFVPISGFLSKYGTSTIICKAEVYSQKAQRIIENDRMTDIEKTTTTNNNNTVIKTNAVKCLPVVNGDGDGSIIYYLQVAS